MKFSDIPAPCSSFRIKAQYGMDQLKEGVIRSITFSHTRIRGEFDILTQDAVVTVVPCNRADIATITDIISSGKSLLAQLVAPAKDGSAELQLAQFFGEQLEMGDLEIGIDEKVLISLKKDSLDAAARALWGQSIIRHGNETYFVIVAGEAAKAYLEGIADRVALQAADGDIENELETSFEQESDTVPTSYTQRRFAILGADLRFALTERNKGQGETIFLASGITSVRNRHEDPSVRLAHGNLRFVDWTVAGEQSRSVKAQMDDITKGDGSYLGKWDEFAEVEGNIFLERVRSVGMIPFDVIGENKDGTITIQCYDLSEKQRKALAVVSELSATSRDRLPPFLKNLEMTFTEYEDGISALDPLEQFLGEEKRRTQKTKKRSLPPDNAEAEDKLPEEEQESVEDIQPLPEIASFPSKTRRKNASRMKKIAFNEATGELILKTDTFPEGDYLICSYVGEIAQIKRRASARRQIQTGRAANSNLGFIIEENGHLRPVQPPPKMQALTYEVMKKVFPENPPTPAQERAIEVALNTPDIALIQGPPGTGKTTVILAIVERLNQECDKSTGISGHVLLTGFQHDAVENMIRRQRINGLPIPKFGQRPGEDEDAGWSRFENDLQQWCDEQVLKLKSRHPQLQESLNVHELRNLCVQYIKFPSLVLAITLLEKALQISTDSFDSSLGEKIHRELAILKNERDAQALAPVIPPEVMAIRVNEKSFADDGPARAADALGGLKDALDISDRKILEQAVHWRQSDSPPPFLQDLRKLRKKLLIQFTPQPTYRQEKVRDSIYNIIREVIEAVRAPKDQKNAAIAELLLAMENNQTGIVDVVKDYAFAFAATCQQSVNDLMQQMKGINNNSTDQILKYDVVIVDEAARVAPRDLMIAMAQGKKIILVGDHRQLPQLTDDDIVKKIEEQSENNAENDWLKKSMFEYLFTERLPQLEAEDGIIRHVTLNRQFRTHHLLGDFISKNFYESKNKEEKFYSGLPDSKFIHDLPETDGKCAIWLDIPAAQGKMYSSEYSYTRPVEADAICDKLSEWITYDNQRTKDPKERFTFGVISFYKAQADMIKNRLGPEFLSAVGDRLRIDTVDSFQGMEFDVVFLSLVRTGGSGFGFLTVYNRLNVSMSRQKKILIAVGDAAFYSTEKAQNKVPGLFNFLNLCRTEGKVL